MARAPLTADRAAPGLAGALCARAEAYTIRLALLYTLLDGERQIKPCHLHAGLALSGYATRSAHWALGHATGDPLAEQIHAALIDQPQGMTRAQLHDLFQRHQPGERVEQALRALTTAGRAHRTSSQRSAI